jgi:hypothetical protein
MIGRKVEPRAFWYRAFWCRTFGGFAAGRLGLRSFGDQLLEIEDIDGMIGIDVDPRVCGVESERSNDSFVYGVSREKRPKSFRGTCAGHRGSREYDESKRICEKVFCHHFLLPRIEYNTR